MLRVYQAYLQHHSRACFRPLYSMLCVCHVRYLIHLAPFALLRVREDEEMAKDDKGEEGDQREEGDEMERKMGDEMERRKEKRGERT